MRATCDELLLKRQFNYEKNDHCHFCVFAAGFDAGVLLERTRDDHNHNASNYCDRAAAARYYDDDNTCIGQLLADRSCSRERKTENVFLFLLTVITIARELRNRVYDLSTGVSALCACSSSTSLTTGAMA